MSLILKENDIAAQPEINWPNLRGIGLGQDLVATRNGGIGGSEANIIFFGDVLRLRRVWLEKRGQAEREDLSSHLPVMLGCWTEDFNRQWFEQITGLAVTRVGADVRCSRHSWRRCTLDGFVEKPDAVWEAKHTNAFSTTDE